MAIEPNTNNMTAVGIIVGAVVGMLIGYSFKKKEPSNITLTSEYSDAWGSIRSKNGFYYMQYEDLPSEVNIPPGEYVVDVSPGIVNVQAHPHGDHDCVCPVCGHQQTAAAGIGCNSLYCRVCGAPMRASGIGERRIPAAI